MSRSPFTVSHRLIQPFSYTNAGPACPLAAFPVVHVYDSSNKPVPIRQVNRDVVLGTVDSTPIVLRQNDTSTGFNIESAPSGPDCQAVRSISVSFGGGATSSIPIHYSICGQLFVTAIFR